MIDVETIDHVQILAPTGSEAAVRQFYGDLLGLVEVEKPLELKARGGVWYRLGPGAVLLHVGVEDQPPDAGRHHVGLRVGDVAGARTALQAAGVRTGDAPRVSGMPRFYAWDPFGNQIEFLAYEGSRNYKRFRTPVRSGAPAPAED